MADASVRGNQCGGVLGCPSARVAGALFCPALSRGLRRRSQMGAGSSHGDKSPPTSAPASVPLRPLTFRAAACDPQGVGVASFEPGRVHEIELAHGKQSGFAILLLHALSGP